MRFSHCVFAASLLLLLTGAESRFGLPQLETFHPRAKAKIAKVSASVRALRPQQSNDGWGDLLDPASNDPACKEPGVRAQLISALTTCAQYPDPISNYTVSPTVAAHRSAWGTYCGSPCVKGIQANLTGSRYWNCMQPKVQYSIASDDYLCSNRDSHGDFCGLTVSRVLFSVTCSDAFDKSTCVLREGGCEWSGNSCSAVMTQTLLSDVCGSCLSGLSKLSSLYPGVGDAIASIENAQQLCATAPSGVYCLPLLTSQLTNGDSAQTLFSSNDKMSALCSNDDLVACFGGFVAVSADEAIASAQDDFVRCAASYKNRSTDVSNFCLPVFLHAVSTSQTGSAFVAAMCTRNHQTYCLPAFFGIVSDEGSSGSSDSCPKNATALVTKLGCCLGTAQSLGNTFTNNTFLADPTLVPPIPGYTPPLVQTSLPPPPPTQEPVTIGEGEELSPNPGSGGLFALGMCGVDGINETLRVRCAQNRFRVTKNLLVKLDYAAVTANAETKQAVLLSLRRDTARAAKVPPNQITDDSISATTRVQVTTTSSRGMRVQASAPGVEYTYTVQASSKAQAEAASANVDAAVNTGYLDLSNTRSTVEEKCAACVGSGGTASISQVSSTTTDSVVTDANGSSPATALGSAVLAMFVTVLVLLP